MERLKLACIFIVLCGLGYGAEGKKPVIYPREGEIFIERNEELRIQCYSNEAKPIQFSFPETETLIPRSEHNISKSPNGTHTFLRRHMTPKDAGWYACAEENVHIDNDFRNLDHMHENISWIYVYVNTENFESLATFSSYNIPKTLIAIAGSNAIVPCRSASPAVEVELWKNFRPTLNDNVVSYNSKIGFIIKHYDFETGEAILQCRISNMVWPCDTYILRLSGPKPKMIPPNDKDVVLQEGNELRIECCSEFPVSFMFPNMMRPNSSIQSEYNISKHENGSHTFIRRHVFTEDTGWYGCAGEGVPNNIPYHSIDYTRKEIDWIYVYVNSSAPIRRELILESYGWEKYGVIPCQPTSPEIEKNLSTWRPTNSNTSSQPGFVVQARLNSRSTLYCTTDELSDYNVSLFDDHYIQVTQSLTIYVIEDADHPFGVEPIGDTIIRMTGENLSMVCASSLPDVSLFRVEWKIPNAVSEDRVQYNWIRADDQWKGFTSFKRKRIITTISSLRRTDSGEYRCLSKNDPDYYRGSLDEAIFVRVIDPNDQPYIKLSELGGEIQVTGVKGGTVKWFVDLENFSSAEITWVNPRNDTVFSVDTGFWNGKARWKMFVKQNLALQDNGVHRLYADLGTVGSSIINVTLDVQVPPIVSIWQYERSFPYMKGERVDVACDAYAVPEPNVTFSFVNCPKFPSREDSVHAITGKNEFSDLQTSKDSANVSFWSYFFITMSGILICKACNTVNCSTDEIEILSSASHKPYFTSTNMNESAAISNLKMDINSTLTLECYASGRPNPNVTWFKGNTLIETGNQFKFAHDNRQLTIQFFLDVDNGRYMCRAGNEHGKDERYIDITVKGKVEKAGTDILRSSLITAASVVIVISWLFIWKLRVKARKKKLIASAFKDGDRNRFNPELSIVDQAHLLPYDQKWEYPRQLLTLDKVLGSGAFGVVRKAEAKSIIRGEPLTTVAVKLVRSTATLNYITALTRELKILGYLGRHPNVVNLLGACTRNVPYGELFVIVEFCRFGNLRDYLWRSRDNFVNLIGSSRTKKTVAANDNSDRIDTIHESPNSNDIASGEDSHQTGSTSTSLRNEEDVLGLDSGKAHCLRSKYKGDYADVTMEEVSTRELVYWAWQISRGMEYLGKRKVVHGDLAARNVLLADNNIVKICDFGLSKALYEEAQYRDQGTDPLPVKWMAVESIKDRVFSYQSDIWSFGVVMWELFTLGEAPYVGIRHRDLYQKLIEGYRMEQPHYATSVIYETMLDCWKADPLERPSFTEIGHNLVNLLDEGFRTQYLEMTSTYMEIDAELFGYARKDYLTLPPSAFDASSSSAIREEIEMKNLP